MKILIFQKECLIYELNQIAKEMNIVLIYTKNVEEAYKIWKNQKIHFIIIDNENYHESSSLITTIRETETDDYTLIMALANEESVEKYLDFGVDDFLIKPIKKLDFENRIRNNLRIIKLYQKQKIIYYLATITQTNDVDLSMHINRVKKYCKILASALSKNPKYNHVITDDFIENLKISSVLHDIGKIAISDKLLNKKGAFSQKEYEEIKKHPEIGYDIISLIHNRHPDNDFLSTCMQVTRSHHERYDGKGYPDGLKGEAIPLSARILAVADVYDALTSQRIYKDKMSHEEAKQMIIEGKGAHFDPEIVDAFLENERKFINIESNITPFH